MKLNYDCIRSVLLYLEKAVTIDNDLKIVIVRVEDIFEELPKYENNEILYSLSKLNEAGYINAQLRFASGSFVDGYVTGITYAGHDFLEKVRDNKTWTNVKSALSKVGSTGFMLIGEAAKALLLKRLGDVIQ